MQWQALLMKKVVCWVATTRATPAAMSTLCSAKQSLRLAGLPSPVLSLANGNEPLHYARYRAASPLTYASNIQTPLLILHSEDDLRCPIQQGDQLFTVLRSLKREVEFVRFPAESHELTRSGSPTHRVQRFEIVLDWLRRHLTG